MLAHQMSSSKKSSYRMYDKVNLLSSIAEESSVREQDIEMDRHYDELW